MAMDENRRPLYIKNLDAISWEEYGTRVRLDPLIKSLFNYSVYRYATIAEALALCDGRMAFARPSRWSDKYESHLVDQLFADGSPFENAVPFVKCFSLEYSSEAMWRTYSGPGGVVRMGVKLGDLINGLDNATWPFDAKLYIGRVRYMDPAKVRKEIETIKKARPKAVMNNAMPGLLMKRAGFAFENEIRIAFLPRSRKDPPETIVARDLPPKAIQRMLLDPYLPQWQTDELKGLFEKRLKAPFKVRRSSFDAHPMDLEIR